MSPNIYHLASFLAPDSDRSPGRVAGDLASAGVPVFPCVPGQKRLRSFFIGYPRQNQFNIHTALCCKL